MCISTCLCMFLLVYRRMTMYMCVYGFLCICVFMYVFVSVCMSLSDFPSVCSCVCVIQRWRPRGTRAHSSAPVRPLFFRVFSSLLPPLGSSLTLLFSPPVFLICLSFCTLSPLPSSPSSLSRLCPPLAAPSLHPPNFSSHRKVSQQHPG